jgi:hypothetical protein
MLSMASNNIKRNEVGEVCVVDVFKFVAYKLFRQRFTWCHTLPFVMIVVVA